MNVLVVLLVAAAVFLLAGRFYSRYIAKSLGEDAAHPTPAITCCDGRDYVPTRNYVVFAHHFSAIAGAGPILGPTMAILYGFVPAWLWVVFGGIFIGAVHDYTTLFISMREGGKSMAEVARKTLGGAGFRLFIAFTLVMIVLVTSSFLSATSISLTSLWPLSKIGVKEGETFLKSVVRGGVVMGRIGGIASTSVIFITLCSPLLGFLLYRKKLKTALAYVLASAICVGSVLLGIAFPVTMAPTTWMIVISVYVLIAAGVPVWLILQPRDFINVQILYGGIGLMIVSLFSCGFQGLTVTMPRFNLAEGTLNLGFIWPMMFITIACGAISGFHCLVAGGTTGKQLSTEPDARRVGYNAMLLESLLSVCVLLALGAVMAFSDYKYIVWPIDPAVKSNPILGFSLAAGPAFPSGARDPGRPGHGLRHPARRRIRHYDARRGRPSQPLPFRRALGDRLQEGAAPSQTLLVQLGPFGPPDVVPGLFERLQRPVADLRHGQPAPGGHGPADGLGLAPPAQAAQLVHARPGRVHDRDDPRLPGHPARGIRQERQLHPHGRGPAPPGPLGRGRRTLGEDISEAR